jgi:hypothetical protein
MKKKTDLSRTGLFRFGKIYFIFSMPKLQNFSFFNGNLVKTENFIEKGVVEKLHKININEWIYIIFDAKNILIKNSGSSSPLKGLNSSITLRRIQTGLEISSSRTSV